MLIKNGSYHLGGTYHRVTKHEPPVQEFVESTSHPSFIFWLFKYRCIDCKQRATEVNEIILRSRSKDATNVWRNRVTLCTECHRKYHDGGVSKVKVEKMTNTRKEFLISIGREKYV